MFHLGYVYIANKGTENEYKFLISR